MSNIVLFFHFQPRKRQIMYSLFGDYRKKIQDDQRNQRQGAGTKANHILHDNDDNNVLLLI